MDHWIKMRKALIHDTRLSGMAEQLNVSPATVLGCLVILWSIADTQTADGKLPRYTKNALDNDVRLPGFADKLEQIGWIRFDDNGAHISEFAKHNGNTAKRRADNSRSKATTRRLEPSSFAEGKPA